MKFSILIPCHDKYVKFLPSLIYNINEQSLQPFEVIIALSNVSDLHADLYRYHLCKLCKSRLVILSTPETRSHGRNRNIAADNAMCDYLLFQDADDLIHKDKLRIFSHYYLKYDPIGIISKLWRDGDDSIKLGTEIYDSLPNRKILSSVHWGGISVKREVFYAVEYDNEFNHGEDVQFARDLITHYGRNDSNVMYIDTVLSYYYHHGCRQI